VGEYNDFSVGPSIATNSWRHVCVTWDGGALRFYQEGVLAGSGVPNAGPFNTLGLSQLVMGEFSLASCTSVRAASAPRRADSVLIAV
jgi:hypothetical protein